VKRYALNEIYFSDLGARKLQDKAALLKARMAGGGGAYSIYNSSDEDIQCLIPPTPAMLSQYQPGLTKCVNKIENQGALSIAARSASGSVSNTIYCGLAGGKSMIRYFPPAPSFDGGITLRLCDEGMRRFGHASVSASWDKGAGVDLTIAVNNGSPDADTVNLSVSTMDEAPPGMRFMLFNRAANSFSELDREGWLQTQIPVKSGETSYYSLIAGNARYCSSIKQQAMTMKADLLGIYPNPFKQMTRIKFSLPFGFTGKVRFDIFDACGRFIWGATVEGRGGPGDFIWNGGRALNAGLYVLSMKAWNNNGEKTGSFQRKMTYLP
jgi:hypothetical protein